jgi:hypothetical protein
MSPDERSPHEDVAADAKSTTRSRSDGRSDDAVVAKTVATFRADFLYEKRRLIIISG